MVPRVEVDALLLTSTRPSSCPRWGGGRRLHRAAGGCPARHGGTRAQPRAGGGGEATKGGAVTGKVPPWRAHNSYCRIRRRERCPWVDAASQRAWKEIGMNGGLRACVGCFGLAAALLGGPSKSD